MTKITIPDLATMSDEAWAQTALNDSKAAPTGSPVYLGDGVYLSDDGFQLWLAVGDHHTKVVALDHGVFTALVAYGQARFTTMMESGK